MDELNRLVADHNGAWIKADVRIDERTVISHPQFVALQDIEIAINPADVLAELKECIIIREQNAADDIDNVNGLKRARCVERPWRPREPLQCRSEIDAVGRIGTSACIPDDR